jgi:hypothetical protein
MMMMMVCGLDSSGSEQGSVAGHCKHGNEALHCIKSGEFVQMNK